MTTSRSETSLNEHELLLSYRSWLRTVASKMTRPDQTEDLAQEGWIAIWRATKTYNGQTPLDWYLKQKAHQRMLTCVTRDWVTIKASQDVPAGLPSLFYVSDEDTVWDALFIDFGDIEWAYHHGEIMQALGALTPREREYVALRFWGGFTFTDLTDYFGYQPQGLWRRSRMKLMSELAHLGA